MLTQAQADKKQEQLRKLAYKAVVARDNLEKALERMQKQRNWEEVCKLTGMSVNSDYGDWMC